MSRTKRIYNTNPRRVFGSSTIDYYKDVIKYKQLCMGHCRNCKQIILADLRKKHTIFLKEMESRIEAWI